MTILVALAAIGAAISAFFFRRGGIYNPIETMPSSTPQPTPTNQTSTPVVEAPGAPTLMWNTPKQAWHAVRVTCDNAGLTLDEKNLICACIYQESEFYNTAVNHNKNAAGMITSTDWGLAQINDWFHIGAEKDFPTVQYVIENPNKVIGWMISMYRHGMLKQWCSYSSGAYKKWLIPTSPMWALAKV